MEWVFEIMRQIIIRFQFTINSRKGGFRMNLKITHNPFLNSFVSPALDS